MSPDYLMMKKSFVIAFAVQLPVFLYSNSRRFLRMNSS